MVGMWVQHYATPTPRLIANLYSKQADKTNERFLHVSVPLVVTIVAMIMAIASTNTGVRYTA